MGATTLSNTSSRLYIGTARPNSPINFMGNKFYGNGKTYLTSSSLNGIGNAIGKSVFVAGAVMDANRFSNNEISGGKLGTNLGMGALGFTGWGAPMSFLYGGVEAFYPGGVEGAAIDNVKYQKEVDAIMNNGNNRTHFYILPWGIK